VDVEPAYCIRAGQTRCLEGPVPKEDTFEEDVGAEHKRVVEQDFREGYGLPNMASAHIELQAPATLDTPS